MKTFETEKHNIPEGATHYIEESNEAYFAWFKTLDGVNYYYSECLCKKWVRLLDQNRVNQGDVKPIPKTNIETPEEKEALDLIDTTLHQYEMSKFSGNKWKNGDVVEYHNKHEGEGGTLTFVGIHPTHKDHSVLYGKHLPGGYMSAPLSMLSKPETQHQLEERERLEAAYDLYLTHEDYIDNPACSLSIFSESNEPKNKWLAVVDKTNYRKGSN